MSDQIEVWKLDRENTQVELLPMDPPPASLDEASRRLPGGGYTTFRTFHRFGVLGLAEHFRRLRETAELAGSRVDLDPSKITAALYMALTAYPAAETRVRLSVDFEQRAGDVYIVVEPLKSPSPEAYRSGVKVVTRQMQRSNPKAKLTGFITTASGVREHLPNGISEAVMIGEDGRALEGLSSNFFGVFNGQVWTAEQGVLSGITRLFVLEVARDAQVSLVMEGVAREQLYRLDEAFITSASRAVLPVTEIDGHKVADGTPGPITLRLLEGYLERVERALDWLRPV